MRAARPAALGEQQVRKGQSLLGISCARAAFRRASELQGARVSAVWATWAG